MWFSEFICGVLKQDKKQFDLKTVIMELGVNAYYKRLAIDACIDLIANTLSRAVFRTFEEGHEVKKNNYYLFNVEPNINQNATDFIHELVSRLVNKNECLVIISKEAQKRFKTKVRELTSRKYSIPMEMRIKKLNQFLVGWVNYYQLAETRSVFKGIEEWLRRRLRMIRWKEWKQPRTRVANLKKLKVSKQKAHE